MFLAFNRALNSSLAFKSIIFIIFKPTFADVNKSVMSLDLDGDIT